MAEGNGVYCSPASFVTLTSDQWLAAGYAISQDDCGHTGYLNALVSPWVTNSSPPPALNWNRIDDFGYLAQHLTAVESKVAIDDYYGARAPFIPSDDWFQRWIKQNTSWVYTDETYFLAPGVAHCGTPGTGSIAPTNPMQQVINWVENGRAPAVLNASGTINGQAVTGRCALTPTRTLSTPAETRTSPPATPATAFPDRSRGGPAMPPRRAGPAPRS
jgi:Tannase and feruloyl esterase